MNIEQKAREEAKIAYPERNYGDIHEQNAYCEGYIAGYTADKLVEYYEGNKNTFPKMNLDESGEFEYSEYVLVLLKDGNFINAKLEGTVNEGKYWYCSLLDDTLNDVTHWQPLPNKPTK